MNKATNDHLPFERSDGEPARFEIGDVIVTEGEPGDCFYVIESGSVEVSRGGELVSILESGDIFGELALTDSGPRDASVVAITDCETRRFDTDFFWDRARSDLKFCHFIMKVSAARVRRSDARLTLFQKSFYLLHGLDEEVAELPSGAEIELTVDKKVTEDVKSEAGPTGANGRNTEKIWKDVLDS